MSELQQADFDAFMREVTGFDPFPWQRRLLDTVLASGWPRLLDLPTGTGKTSTLLIGLFALALAPERSPRRMALIVDRRIIVNQVDGFARRIRAALDDPGRPICARVAATLRALSSAAGSEPVRVVQLRGGIPRDDSWLGKPDQPTIIASTVDQIGSRLLFRGYGVSESMRPIHAGILARDSLFLLDEVHLATAFEETLGRLEKYTDWPERGGTGRRLQVVRMSATLRGEADEPFGLDADDRAHPVLARRLTASRGAKLELVKTKRATTAEQRVSNRALLAEAASSKALEAARAGAKGIGVVVNRVDTARRTAARLRGQGDAEVLLVTGRMRPYDKTAIQARLDQTVAAGLERDADASTTFVVATNCIEAGADLDFDAIVTEVASLDALRQRFGRFNRLGKHATTAAWVLGPNDQLGSKAPEDPVYGEALKLTWDYLNEHAQDQRVDFGLSAFCEPDAERRKQLLPPAPEAPLLFPSYLDMWSETRPAPYPDPDPALWLHGKQARAERDVNLVFRADIPAAPAEVSNELADAVAEALEFLPPVADETVSVAIEQLRDWLSGFGDARAWRWTADGLDSVEVANLQPGDTVIVPADRGGLGAGTWDPDSSEPVDDVGERATWEAKQIAKLRLDRRTLPAALREGVPTPIDSDDPDELEAAKQACRQWLLGLSARTEQVPDDWRPLLSALAAEGCKYVLTPARMPSGDGIWRVTLVPRRRAIEATTEDAVSVFSGLEVRLEDHLRDVEAWAGAFASSAGLAPELASDVALAGLLHDLGKADARFQALLHGGDPIRAAGTGALAKSRQFGSARGRKRAQERSGWPEGLRHELVSLALLDASPELQAKANDLELVRHLVASHHGWCRPWAPTTVDPKPMLVRFRVANIDVEVSTAALDDAFFNECASRFRRLCRRYGWHGLAYLEALLRLGDHRASATPGLRPGAEQ